MAKRLTEKQLAASHDGLCSVAIGDGDCTCLVQWVRGLQEENDQLQVKIQGSQDEKAKYFTPAQLKRINEDPALVSLLYDLNLLPEVFLARIRHAKEEERKRCIRILHEAAHNHRGASVQTAWPENAKIILANMARVLGEMEAEMQEKLTKGQDCACGGYDPDICVTKDAHPRRPHLLQIICDNAYHDRGHGICTFCVQKRIDAAKEPLLLELKELRDALESLYLLDLQWKCQNYPNDDASPRRNCRNTGSDACGVCAPFVLLDK